MLISMFKSSFAITVICIGVFGLIGYSIATFKIPDSNSFELTKKAGGESIDQIILRYIKFKNKKNRIYVYKGGNK